MVLSDRRLRFARDLIEHWLHIRRGALVPRDEDLDPPCFENIAIADLTQPTQVIFELAGARVSRRSDRDLRHVNWWISFRRCWARRASAHASKSGAAVIGMTHEFDASGDRPDGSIGRRQSSNIATSSSISAPVRPQRPKETVCRGDSRWLFRSPTRRARSACRRRHWLWRRRGDR